MNKKGLGLIEVVLSGVCFIIVLLVSPFMFEFLGVANLPGVEGFIAKTIPFVMLWFSLTYGSRRVAGVQ